MKTIIKRHGLIKHNFSPDQIICPDCKHQKRVKITDIIYKDNQYILTCHCSYCHCLFTIVTEELDKKLIKAPDTP